jgi:PEP-CTERM motif
MLSDPCLTFLRSGGRRALAAVLAVAVSAPLSFGTTVLLDETWADGTRTDTSLPNESAVYASAASSATTTVGSLAYAQGTGSQRLATYFAPNGSPIQLGVGEVLKATIDFVPKTMLYDVTSRNFRVGLFHDPTNSQISADGFNDAGGSGNPWEDAEGYAIFMPLTTGVSGNTGPFQINKRTVLSGNTSLLGSGGAYTTSNGSGTEVVWSLDKTYTLMFQICRVSDTQTDLMASLMDGATLLSSHTVSDDGSTFGSAAPYNDFDLLAFRFSSASGTADVLDFRRFRIETGAKVPEPATGTMLGLSGAALAGLLRRRR